ncbi:MAG: hypothetical protein Q9162_004692 [Coniocarpon cinnabarinum]
MSSAKGSVELEEWFADKGRMDEEQPCTPQEAQAVRDYAVASPDRTALTTEQAAHLLLKADTEHPNMNDPKEKGYRIASLIFDVQRDYDDLQPLMLDLLEAIEHFDSNSTVATSINNLSRTNMKACSRTSGCDEMGTDHWVSNPALRSATRKELGSSEDLAKRRP